MKGKPVIYRFRTAGIAWLIGLLGVVVSLPASASESTHAGAFLLLPVSAFEVGLGQATVAADSEATAFHWNPGGVGRIQSLDVAVSYNMLYGNLASHQVISAGIPIGYDLVLGASWVRVGVDDIPVYPSLSGYTLVDRMHQAQSASEDGEYMSYSESAYFLTLARRNDLTWNAGWQYLSLPVTLPVGVSAKYITVSAGDTASASGIGFDAGAQLGFDLGRVLDRDILGLLYLGVSTTNVFGTRVTWDTPQGPDEEDYFDKIPQQTHWGATYDQPLDMIQSHVIASLAFTGYGRTWGLEYRFRDMISLRLGKDMAEDNDLAFGAGCVIRGIRADYAIQRHALGVSHRVSLHYQY